MKVRHDSPRDAFVWGKHAVMKVYNRKGYYAAKDFTESLRAIWMQSKDYKDKKVYDGAKLSLESVFLSSCKLNNKEIFYGRVSKSLEKAFGAEFLKKYGLNNARDLGEKDHVPCVYFGAYRPEDFEHISKNKSKFKIIVYGGTDATIKRYLTKLKNVENLYHIAISDYVSEDLRQMSIPHKQVAITPVDHSKYNLVTEPLGESVYVYTSPSNPRFYGKRIYEMLQKDMPDIDFKVCTHKTYSREDLIDVYKNCFMGLRLVSHDGLPNTVIELGLMGRRTAHNGGLPSGIPWRSSEDLKNIIRAEKEKVGKAFPEISEKTKSFLNNSRDWLSKSFWEE